ncbi:streptophobe family protein [Streptomyces sp. LX-29]|uniref:streptophobe family protein n=1 Tax=Streptomyces sp. LX-29 TaxID=2900152 RepID=UPI00240CEB8A|nr:streptophobe family protein [Streptomyces sp. LX-29]WFB10820.1 streptophobe family protein [Streptomyces sp. LX-29]
MSQTPRSAPDGVRHSAQHALRAWWDALAAVVAALAAMFATAALGLWAAGAGDLPGGAFPRVVAAAVVSAVGGEIELTGEVGFVGGTDADLDVIPLSVSLVGALTLGALFLLPLRHRAVAGGGEILGRAGRTALLWLLGLLLVVRLARHSFRIGLGDELAEEIGEALGVTPTVGFRAAVAPTLVLGLLWLLVVLALALAVSRTAPLPSRLLPFQDTVRPAVFAVVALLLAYVAAGLVAGVIVAIVRGKPVETFAVLLLGLPNLAWMALGLGLGGAWVGRVPAPVGLPMPKPLADVLRETDGGEATVNLASLAERDGRAWLLAVFAALAVLATGVLLALRSPAGTAPWRLALRLGVALAVTLLAVGLLTRVSADFGLNLLGLGDLADLGGEVTLRPASLLLLGLGALWGALAGLLGGLLAPVGRWHGTEVPADRPGRTP